MSTIYLNPSAGSPAVIKIGDTCYMLVGPSSVPPDTSSFDSEESDCGSCFCDCDPPTEVNVSGNFTIDSTNVSFSASDFIYTGVSGGAYRYTSTNVSQSPEPPTYPAITSVNFALYCDGAGWHLGISLGGPGGEYGDIGTGGAGTPVTIVSCEGGILSGTWTDAISAPGGEIGTSTASFS